MANFSHETERLILRDWHDQDWDEFWKGTNTPAVMKWLGGVLNVAGRKEARARLESYRRDHGHTFWAVERKNDGAILGFCGLKRCNQAGGPFGTPEIGWRLREGAWGRGYAKEAAKASLELAFARFGADEVIAITVQGNAPSWGLMLALGMRRREDLDFVDPNAVWDDHDPTMIIYSMKRDEWSAAGG
ncbi:MAG: GNAT family N-acetyltransferase [Erythrobacter sp.]